MNNKYMIVGNEEGAVAVHYTEDENGHRWVRVVDLIELWHCLDETTSTYAQSYREMLRSLDSLVDVPNEE